MENPKKIDLHMHSTVSDGTDTPEELLARVREAGLAVFSLTDHDAVKGCGRIRSLLTERDPAFLTGIEFSCRDEEGKYHILGYGFDPDAASIRQVVETGHAYRMRKVRARLDFLETRFGICFPEEERSALLALDNPGKPHIANLMVKHGYAETKEQAMQKYINLLRFRREFVSPKEAIAGILGAGGIPVLAHPAYGSGEQHITGEEMEQRLRRLTGFGLQGLEAFYSGFSAELSGEMLRFAERFGLYVTAGSDYHGANKAISLGDTGLDENADWPAGLRRFLEDVKAGPSREQTDGDRRAGTPSAEEARR